MNTNIIKYKSISKSVSKLIYKELVRAIAETMYASGSSFIIGDFPYWREHCEFITSSNRPSLIINHATCIEPGYIEAQLTFEPKFQKKVSDKYGIILQANLYISCRNDGDYFPIERAGDFKLLKDIRTPYLFINTDEDATRVQSFIDDYEKLIIMHMLEN